jgi:hypothetical protein
MLRNFHNRGRASTNRSQKMMPQKFNQNSTSENSATAKFSCFPTIEEKGANFQTQRTLKVKLTQKKLSSRLKAKLTQKKLSTRPLFKASTASLRKEENPLQHGDRTFHQNLSSETHLLSLGGWSLHRWSIRHWSLPSPGSQQSTIQLQGKQSNQLKYQ